MSKISSDIRGLEEQVDRLKGSAERVNNIYSQFNSLKNSIDNVIRQRHNINYQLDTASKGIKSLGERLDNSGIHINSAINSYLYAERRLESLVAGLEVPQNEQEQSNNIFDEPTRKVYIEDSKRVFSKSSYMTENIPYHDMMDIIKQIDEQMKISKNQLNEWSSAKYIADAKIKELFKKLKELDTGEITTGVAEGGYNETGVWEHYKKYIKKNELLYKEKIGQTITPYDIYEFARLSAMADLIDVYGDSVYITKNEHLIQSKISESLGVNVQILENNDILFIDKNVIWKYVGEDTYEASRNLVHGGYGARSVEACKRLNESPAAIALGHAVQNRSLDLTVEDLQFLYSMDPHGAKEYVTGVPGHTQKEKQHKKELREELYKLLTGEKIQYYKHKWFNWEKTDNPEGDIWGTVKSNADFALEVNDGIPDDLLSVVKPITYTVAAFYGMYSLGVFLEGVSIYGLRIASGLAANGMLKEMIVDYNSTLGATDADEQFIINALNSTDKDEEFLGGTKNIISEADRAKIDRWNFTPNDDLYLKYKNVYDNPKYFNQSTGNPIYPGTNGDVNIEGFTNGKYSIDTLKPNTIIDRYGSNGNGKYFSPDGISFESRALPPFMKGQPYTRYKVIRPFSVKTGEIAPWFDQAGRGTQYLTEMGVDELIKNGFLKIME